MSKAAGKEFNRAYDYLRVRTEHMQYAAFRSKGLPIGSGVTEAACKTVFTQRLSSQECGGRSRVRKRS